jgi:hypothetical protein
MILTYETFEEAEESAEQRKGWLQRECTETGDHVWVVYETDREWVERNHVDVEMPPEELYFGLSILRARGATYIDVLAVIKAARKPAYDRIPLTRKTVRTFHIGYVGWGSTYEKMVESLVEYLQDTKGESHFLWGSQGIRFAEGADGWYALTGCRDDGKLFPADLFDRVARNAIDLPTATELIEFANTEREEGT